MNKYEKTPEYILDLHGFTTKQAKSLLDEIITKAEYTHVRIITGKGTFRESGPVMKNYVQQYLQERGISFKNSKLYLGGEGALEVFLKK